MKLLVTGGAGYIGSHFCKAAQKAGHQIVVYDNFSTGHREFCKFGKLVEGDLLETSKLEKALKDFSIDGVVHFAAKALVGESMQKPELYWKNNLEGTGSLVQALKSHPVDRFLFSSSCATYGVKNQPITEDTTQEPVNPYGESKLACERLLLDQAPAICRHLALLRYFNVIGCDPDGELFELHEPETHIVPNVLKAANAKTEFKIFGGDFPTEDGTCVRDYVDVNDLAQVHLAALSTDIQTLVSNVATGVGQSNLQILKACQKSWNKDIAYKISERRPGDPPSLVASNVFFKSWYKKPLTSLESSLRTLVPLLK